MNGEPDLRELLFKYKGYIPRSLPDDTLEFYAFEPGNLEVHSKLKIEEPKTSAQKLENFTNTILIIPALAFDLEGHRLGFGRGYYDRFIEVHRKTIRLIIGVCFDEFIREALPQEEHDQAVDCLVTPSKVYLFTT